MGKCLSIPIITLSIYNVNVLNGTGYLSLISKQEQDEIKAMLPDYLKHLSGYLQKRKKPLLTPSEINEINQAIFSRNLLMDAAIKERSEAFNAEMDKLNLQTDTEQARRSTAHHSPGVQDAQALQQLQSLMETAISQYGSEFTNKAGIQEFREFFNYLHNFLSTESIYISPIDAIKVKSSQIAQAWNHYKQHHLQYHPLTAIFVQTTNEWIWSGNLSEEMKDRCFDTLSAVLFKGFLADHGFKVDGIRIPKNLATEREFNVRDGAPGELMYSLYQISSMILRTDPNDNVKSEFIKGLYRLLFLEIAGGTEINTEINRKVPSDYWIKARYTGLKIDPMKILYDKYEREGGNFGWIAYDANFIGYDDERFGNHWTFSSTNDFETCIRILMDISKFKNKSIKYEDIEYKLPSLDNTDLIFRILWQMLHFGQYNLRGYNNDEIIAFIRDILKQKYVQSVQNGSDDIQGMIAMGHVGRLLKERHLEHIVTGMYLIPAMTSGYPRDAIITSYGLNK